MTPGTSNYVLKVLKYPGQIPKAKLRIHSFLPADVKGSWKTAFYVDRKERQVPKPAKLHAIVLCQTPWKPGAPRVTMLKQHCAASTTSYHSQSRLLDCSKVFQWLLHLPSWPGNYPTKSNGFFHTQSVSHSWVNWATKSTGRSLTLARFPGVEIDIPHIWCAFCSCSVVRMDDLGIFHASIQATKNYHIVPRCQSGGTAGKTTASKLAGSWTCWSTESSSKSRSHPPPSLCLFLSKCLRSHSTQPGEIKSLRLAARCNKCWHHRLQVTFEMRSQNTVLGKDQAQSDGRTKETRKMGCMRFFLT